MPVRQTAKIGGAPIIEVVMPIRMPTTAITATTWTEATTTTTFARASVAAMKTATAASIDTVVIPAAHTSCLTSFCRKFSASSRFAKETER